MKYVIALFAIALAAGVANAGENTFKFNYYNNHSFYACSYAEGQVAKTLKALGADAVETDCTGGIGNGNLYTMPVNVEAVYTASEKGERTVVLRGNEACDFNVKLIKAALEHFDHQVVKAQNTCLDGSGRYRFEVVVK